MHDARRVPWTPGERRDRIGTPGGIRTPDPVVRSHVLWSTELRARARRGGERGDSNPRSPGPQPGALTATLRPPRARPDLAPRKCIRRPPGAATSVGWPSTDRE